MSIHDFHSKLTSGKEEGRLIEGLRRMAAATSLTAGAESWTVWMEGEEEGGAGSLCEAGA
jgi:hypothetical protein